MSEFDNAQLPGIEDVILPQSSEVEEKKEEQVKPASPAKETAKQASFEKNHYAGMWCRPSPAMSRE